MSTPTPFADAVATLNTAITKAPITVNIYRCAPCDEIVTEVFDNQSAALMYAMDEQDNNNTVHVTVTNDETGEKLFDEPGILFAK